VKFMNTFKERWGVEPICQTLEFAPSTYYAATSRPPSAREVRDDQLKPEIERVHKENFDVYGVEKMWKQLRRESIAVGRDQVGRLMAALNLYGVVRGKTKRTTIPGDTEARPADLVDRIFKAVAPNLLWVADLTYVSTWAGTIYVSFVIDVFSRRIVGWRVSSSLRAELALDALEMAIWTSGSKALTGLVHHSDRGVQGGFKQRSQHLTKEELLQWRVVSGVDRTGRTGRLWALLGGPALACITSGSDSGKALRSASRARKQRWQLASLRPLGRAGSAIVAACPVSALLHSPGDTSPTQNEKTSRSCAHKTAACVK